VDPSLTFSNRLEQAWKTANSLLCVGLDPVPDRLPQGLGRDNAAIETFCREVVAATGDLVCAFKPQIAHFSAIGAESELERVIHYIHRHFPQTPIILDAKRGDIGSTAARYAQECFERYQADAVTVNPYLGTESLEPFLAYRDKGVVVLCRTSNPGSDWVQNYPSEDPLYLRVARQAKRWNEAGNVMLVVGATYPDALAAVRSEVGAMPLLVPGVGAQGGNLQAVMQAGSRQGKGLVISSSRAILYASQGADFQLAARAATERLRSQINACRVTEQII